MGVENQSRPIDALLTRRKLLGVAVAAPVAVGAYVLATRDGSAGDSESAELLTPTKACADGDEPTLAQTEGPFFTPDSPRRRKLREAGMAGRRLVVAGTVVDTRCRPIKGALLDFWQADDAGNYDNEGYRLRGHQFSGEDGRYRLDTIVPGLYPGRTRHIHVKVQRRGGPVLTTQLYLPREPANASDGLYDASLQMRVRRRDGVRTGTFRFVLS
jgi:protocatechuate 3,4-dioxygenase beta subunit